MTILERVKQRIKINEETGCWEWQGVVGDDGYARLLLEKKGKRKNHRLARLVWKELHGDIASNILVCHKCDNPGCINPDHLWIGTHLDNMRDMVAKGRQAIGKRNGKSTHPEKTPIGDNHWTRKHPEFIKRGDLHPNAKLKSNDVLEIRKKINSGLFTSQQLADMYNVTYWTIRDIILKRSWNHL